MKEKDNFIRVGLNILEERALEKERTASFTRFICVFLSLLLLIACLRSFVFFSVQVEGSSMENTLQNGDKLVVDKTASLSRCAVVVFKVKGIVPGETDEEKMYIKRIIGVAGDTVWSENGDVYREYKDKDGNVVTEKVDEPYAKGATYLRYSPKIDVPKTVVPENCYFLMGDNRQASFDCRFFGNDRTPKCVSSEYICGVVPELVANNKDSKILQALMRFV